MQLFGYYIDPVAGLLTLWAVVVLAVTIAAAIRLSGHEERENRAAALERLSEFDRSRIMPRPYVGCYMCEGAQSHGPRVMQLHQKTVHGVVRW